MATKQKQTRAERKAANREAWARMTDDEKKVDWERKHGGSEGGGGEQRDGGRNGSSGRPEPRSAPSDGENRRRPSNSSANGRRVPEDSASERVAGDSARPARNGRRPPEGTRESGRTRPPPPLDVTRETVRVEANGHDPWYVDDSDLAERRARAYQQEAVKGGRFHEPYVISRTCICARPLPLRERWDDVRPFWRCVKCGRDMRGHAILNWALSG